MYLMLFLLGLIIGRNISEIYQRTYKDMRKVLQTLTETQVAGTTYLMVEGIFVLLMRKVADSHRKEHDMLHPCHKAVCAQCGGRPMNINTYVRKIKAYN